jgi:exosortase
MQSATPASEAETETPLASASPGGDARRGDWRRAALGWAACGLLAALAYRDVLWAQPARALSGELEDWFFVPSSSFAPVVVSMSLWLLYRRLPRLGMLVRRPGARFPGALLLGAGVGVYLWAIYTGSSALLVPSLILNAFGAAWLWGGAEAVRSVRLPVLFLVFAMPLPGTLLNQVIFALQLGTTELAGAMLYALGVPHVVSGERILRPEHTFSVIEACSGLRSIEILTLVAILMTDLFRRTGLHAWLVVLAAAPVAFVMNGLRATLLILNPHSEIAAIHTLQGIAILVGGLVVLFLLDGFLGWLERRRGSGVPGSPARGRPRGEPDPGPPLTRGAAAVAGVLVACAAASLWGPRWEPPHQPYLSLDSRFKLEIGGVRTAELDTDRLFLGSATFREHFTLRYSSQRGHEVVLFFGLGSPFQPGRSALSPKTALPGSGWIVEERSSVVLEPDGRVVEASVLRSGGSRVLSYHWTEGASAWPIEALREFLALDSSPFTNRQGVRVVRIGAALVGSAPHGKQQVEEKLVSFYHLLRPLLDELEKDLSDGRTRA